MFERPPVDQGSDVDAFFQTVADLQSLDRGDESLDEALVDAALNKGPVGGDARLAGVSELGNDRRLDGLLKIGIVEDQ